METAITWLIIGGPCLVGVAGLAGLLPEHTGLKIAALWAACLGLAMVLIAGTLQFQQYIVRAASPVKQEDIANRPWLGIDVELAGPLTIGRGLAIPLKITMTNSAGVPAVSALAFPMIFTREKQPFLVEEIIKRRTASFQTGGGLGYSVFQNKPITEINIPSNDSREIEGQDLLAPYILVAVKYKAPGGNKTYLTAILYTLSLRTQGGGARVIPNRSGPVPEAQLGLTALGSYAD